MVELKPAITYEEQMKLLLDRGVTVNDPVLCKKILSEISYYRLSAYFLPFRNDDGSYKAGTDFSRVYRIYEFDRKLRHVIFSAVEEIEIYLRTKLAYYHAHHYGAEGYMKPENFGTAHQSQKFKENIKREIENNKRSPFVRHHIEKYEGRFPVWVISELFTFGMLSRFYSDLKTPDKKELAKDLYGTTERNVSSWLRCVTDLRNICAHYGRLYYRIFTAVPAGMGRWPESAKRRLWGAILALKELYPDSSKWNSEVLPAMTALFDEYSEDIELYHIAFPEDWKNCLRMERGDERLQDVDCTDSCPESQRDCDCILTHT